MIQFNLLPAIKLEFMRAKRLKRLVMLVSVGVSALGIAVVVLLFLAVNVVQKNHIDNLDKDIQNHTANLKDTQDIDKILTVQNQLNSITELHDKKPAVNRLYQYLAQLTPENTSISKLEIDFELNTVKVTGQSDTLETNNKFVDTLKFTTYTIAPKEGEEQSSEPAKAFQGVVLANFGRDDTGASYTVEFTYDPVIFDNTQKVTLSVPSIISTRSVTEKPLFIEVEPVEGEGE